MPIAILILTAVLSPLVFATPRRAKWAVAVLLASIAAVAVIWQSVTVIASGEVMRIALPSDGLFGEGVLEMDALAAVFAAMVSVISVTVTIYAGGYIKSYGDGKSSALISLHYCCLQVMFVSMVLVTLSRDAFAFLFSWELMTIASFLLILFDASRREVRKAALNYLILMHVGFVALVCGFVLLSSGGLVASFDSLPVYFASNNPFPLFLIFFLGFGMKAGLFPLHLWLPEAHPAAPAHVSALMSGVMIKMGVYGMIRLVMAVGPGLAGIGIFLFSVGAVTALWGIILAAVQNDMKKLLAYSSIENVGIIITALGASAIGRAYGADLLAVFGLAGALLHTVNHSMFKSLLFMGSGNVYTATHTTALDALGGIGKKMPLTAGIFLLGVIAITALPPLCGFISEFMVYYGFLGTVASGTQGVVVSIIGIVVLSLVGGIALLAFIKLFGTAFLGHPRSDSASHATEVDARRIAAMAIPASGIILGGLGAWFYMDGFLEMVRPLAGAGEMLLTFSEIYAPIWNITIVFLILLLLSAGLALYRNRQVGRRGSATSPVWGCGFTVHSPRMQYSGESFSEGLYGISTSLTQNTGKGEVVDKGEIFPGPHTFDVKRKDKISTLFSAGWVRLMQWFYIRATRFNTGKVNHYIMYALVFLALILLLTIGGVI